MFYMRLENLMARDGPIKGLLKEENYSNSEQFTRDFELLEERFSSKQYILCENGVKKKLRLAGAFSPLALKTLSGSMFEPTNEGLDKPN